PEAPAAEGEGWTALTRAALVRRVHSLERLLDETTLFLHRNVADVPEARRSALEDLHRSEKILPGKKVLVVDDDIRNIFALSTVLEEQDMVVVTADNGRDAIKTPQSQSDVDSVLMDIMI